MLLKPFHNLLVQGSNPCGGTTLISESHLSTPRRFSFKLVNPHDGEELMRVARRTLAYEFASSGKRYEP